MFPIAMELGPDGAFYVSTPAIGASDGSGAIVRIGPAAPPPPAAPRQAAHPPAGRAHRSKAPPARCPHPHPGIVGTGLGASVGSGVSAGLGPGRVRSATESTVTIADFAFGPAELSVAAGTTVTFVNNDSAPHTATADDGSFDTGEIPPGESATVTLDTAGTFAYHCEIHPSMTATLTVT